jgi:hypothetical protein
MKCFLWREDIQINIQKFQYRLCQKKTPRLGGVFNMVMRYFIFEIDPARAEGVNMHVFRVSVIVVVLYYAIEHNEEYQISHD